MPASRRIFLAAMSLMVAACEAPLPGGGGPPPEEPTMRIVMLGDSLTAGFGLADPNRLVKALEIELQKAGLEVDVVNAGISGDTLADGRARFDWSVQGDVDGVLIELGANDLFVGRAPAAVAEDLTAIVDAARAQGLWVGIVGMKAFGAVEPAYRDAFDGVFATVSAQRCVPLYPFYFEGLIDAGTGAVLERALFLPDGVHPSDDGVDAVAGRLGPWLARAIKGEEDPC